MNVSPEVAAIEERVKSSSLAWDVAVQELVRLQKKKSWTTKEWRAERAKRIATACAQCGSDQPPLVLQHFWHPQSFGQIFRALAGLDAWRTFKKEHDAALAVDLVVERPTCPTCESTNIKTRKTMSGWCCYGCGSVCPEPRMKAVLRLEGRKALAQRHRKSKVERWRAFQERFGPMVGREAVLESIEESRRYLSFADTATFCKKCAFAWDCKGLRLCTMCRSRWHSIIYPCCSTCSATANQPVEPTLHGGRSEASRLAVRAAHR